MCDCVRDLTMRRRYSLSWPPMLLVTVGLLTIAIHSVPRIVASERRIKVDLVSHHRKLLSRATMEVEPNRIWADKCSKSDIEVSQGPTSPLPSGIPTYTVEIVNVCPTGCDISDIHLRCRLFSSAKLINPKIFKRIRFDDCLVNDGKPLASGRTISFQYANTFSYPLSVLSVKC